jgi:hypothetical protein
MRKLFVLAGVLAMLSFGVDAVAAATGPSVTGGGKTATDIFSVNAHSDVPLLGGPATGHLVAKENPIFRSVETFNFAGDVTCLRTLGPVGVVGGTVTQDEINGVPVYPTLHGFWFFVVDNGNQKGLPDAISYEYVVPTSPGAVCPAPFPPFFPLLQGNVNVND